VYVDAAVDDDDDDDDKINAPKNIATQQYYSSEL
jgi:hypothetical protein